MSLCTMILRLRPGCALGWLVVALCVALPFLLGSALGQPDDGIFPTYYLRYGNPRAKRLHGETDSYCRRCVLTYNREDCLRCWTSNSKDLVIPIHANKRDDGAEMEEGEGVGEEGLVESKRYGGGYYSTRSQPMLRHQRGSGCGCCYMSRFSNFHCCRLCNMASKRTGKRSGELMASDMAGVSPAADFQAPAADKRAYRINPDCFCCLRNTGYSSQMCCARCFKK